MIRAPGARVLLMGIEDPGSERRSETDKRFGAIADALSTERMECEIRWVLGRASFLEALGAGEPDLVFCFFHAFAEDGPGPHGILDARGIGYVGSIQASIDAAISKPMMKAIWTAAGIRTPEWSEASADGQALAPSDAGPWIVKPANGGNSDGIGAFSIVRTCGEAAREAATIASRFGSAIVERYLGDYPDFREFTAVLIGAPDDGIVSPAEIRLIREDGPRIVMSGDKRNGGTRAVALPGGPFAESLRDFARECFGAAAMRDYARCDIIYADGKFWAIEINGQPMMPDPWFDACAAASGIDSAESVRRVFVSAMTRLDGERRRAEAGRAR